MNVQNLLKTYQNLSELRKALLRLKALLYFKTPVEGLRKCLYNLQYLFPKKDILSVQDFNAHINFLKSQHLLDRVEMLPRALIHSLTLEALDSEYASEYLNAIRTTSELMKERLYNSFSHREIDLNNLRLAIYTNNEEGYLKAIKKRSEEVPSLLKEFFLVEPLSIEWLKMRPIAAQEVILFVKLNHFCLTGSLSDHIPALLTHYLPLRDQENYRTFSQAFLLYDVLSGNTTTATRTIQTYDQESPLTVALKSIVFFISNNNDQAISSFEEALKLLRKFTGRRKVSFQSLETLIYCLALFRTQSRQTYPKIQSIIDLAKEAGMRDYAFYALQRVILKLQGLESKADRDFTKSYGTLAPLSSAIGALADYWFDEEGVNVESCKSQFKKYQNTLPLVGKIFAEILCKIAPDHEYETYLAQEQFKDIISFVECVQMGESWQRALENLDYYFNQQGFSSSNASKRLVWHFNPKSKSVDVIEQAQTKGKWNKGRIVALKRFHERDPKLDYLTDEDKRVIKTLEFERGWRGHVYSWHPIKTPIALVGHPCVYHEGSKDLRLDLALGTPELVVKQQGQDQFHLSLSHTAFDHKIFIEQETPSRYKIVEFPKSMVPLVEILGTKGINVPAKAKDHLISIIQKASPMLLIHSEIEFMDIPAQEGDPTPCVHITPLDQGLKVNLLVRPFGDKGPYFRPGHGRSPLIVYLESQQLKANRSLEEERKRADDLIKSCHYLSLSQDGSDEWLIEEPDDCLETLSDFQELTDVKLEWPEGQKLSVTKSSSFEHLSMNITQERDWFAVNGSLKVDEDTVVELQPLLKLMDQAEGRFIPLNENKFIALSSHFKKQLQELKAMTEETGEGYRIHALGSFSLKNFANQAAHVDSDKKWKEKIKTFQEAETYQPKLPATLQANLREYQQEGFDWLSRLSYLGVGACLADDMGLGKTLQALAVLLNHAPHGPCLVVAPTSVCHNWESEIEKFAPTLNPHTLGGGNREKLIASLKEMDVLICSYSLLQQEEELLVSREWQMIVLDEAQAIKNASTKRFQAAIKLQAKFKLALTGTPIENSLEEIWSLFRFINPGLLGSKESFQRRFLTTTEKESDKGKRGGLKSLVQRFMLRRTKNAVLQELPPRTEQTILVEMTPEELAFYEALRRQAITNLSSLEEQSGQRKIHILAEITRLRRACCHPALVQKGLDIPSSKLKTFFHLVDDLLQNNHQALVFSQYIECLGLVRQELDRQGIPYQYLDGSTPALERKKQVQAFQEGKSSLFLLSLKAGGSGLNLTAADYVIHLDPWWNPAVEDQASDRAHRLGQKRPVTIYRLIVQNSIEEKILELHKDKRDMADDLLEGSQTAEKMTEEDLIKLISL